MHANERQRRSFAQIRGSLSAFRTSIPENRGRAAIKIEGVNVRLNLNDFLHGQDRNERLDVKQNDIDQTRQILKRLAQTGGIATVGIFSHDNRHPELAWLVSAAGNLVPFSHNQTRRLGVRALLRWLPWMLGLLGLCVFSLVYFMASFWFVLLGALAVMPLLVCGGMVAGALLALLRSRSKSTLAVEAACEAAMRGDGPSRAMAAVSANEWRSTAGNEHMTLDATRIEREQPGEPALRRLTGRIRHLRMENDEVGGSVGAPVAGGGVVYGSNRMRFHDYFFDIDGQQYVVYASRNFGGAEVFLAEGDEVELLVLDESPSATSPVKMEMVLAFHNREDGSTYASHRVMSPVAKRLRRPLIGRSCMTFLTRRYRNSARLMLLLCWILTILILNAGGLFLASVADRVVVMVISLLMFPAIWLIFFELPFWLWDARWRMGRPSKRQRLTERVYAGMGLGFPLDPEWCVTEV